MSADQVYLLLAILIPSSIIVTLLIVIYAEQKKHEAAIRAHSVELTRYAQKMEVITAHELRTPLTVVIAALGAVRTLLERAGAGGNDAAQAQAAAVIPMVDDALGRAKEIGHTIDKYTAQGVAVVEGAKAPREHLAS